MRTDGIRPLPRSPRAAVAHLRRVDRKLARAIDAVGPIVLGGKPADLGAFCKAIVGQQLSTVVASKINERFVACAACEGIMHPERVLSLSDDQLRAVGLSQAKMNAVRALAAHWAEESLSHEVIAAMPDEEVLERMTQVKGIGPWTVKMILIFCLRRPDVLPQEDLGLRTGMQKIYNLRERPTAADVERIAEPWRPWRTVGTWYCWRILKP